MEAKTAVDVRSSVGFGATTASASTLVEDAASTPAPLDGAASADPARATSSTTDGDRATDVGGKADAAHARRRARAKDTDPNGERGRREERFRRSDATGRS